MKLKMLLEVSAIYMGLIGIAFLLVPEGMGLGAIPAGVSAALVAYLRIPAGVFIGIAIINWMSRKTEPSTALGAVVLGNIFGFGITAALQAFSVLGGNPLPTLVVAAIDALFAVAFILALVQGQARQPNSA